MLQVLDGLHPPLEHVLKRLDPTVGHRVAKTGDADVKTTLMAKSDLTALNSGASLAASLKSRALVRSVVCKSTNARKCRSKSSFRTRSFRTRWS